VLVDQALLLAILLQAVAVAQELLVETGIALLLLVVMAALDWLLQLVAQAHITQGAAAVALDILLPQVVALLQLAVVVVVALVLLLAMEQRAGQIRAAAVAVAEDHLHLLLVGQV
jgi:hypothetical protein